MGSPDAVPAGVVVRWMRANQVAVTAPVVAAALAGTWYGGLVTAFAGLVELSAAEWRWWEVLWFGSSAPVWAVRAAIASGRRRHVLATMAATVLLTACLLASPYA